jgi:aerobic carbon-monoxide dehydrogenase small subunit
MSAVKENIELSVDNETIEVSIRSHHLLIDILRDHCGRKSVKEGCESAACGACTILLDGQPTLSCITFAIDAVGRNIQTAEGLSGADGSLHPLQKAFVDHHAIQCGFCTPGMLMASLALLESNPSPSEVEIRTAISGHMCRCTGYVRIVHAIAAAVKSGGFRAQQRLRETV